MSWWHDQAGRYPLLTPAQEIHYGQQVRAWLDHPDPVPEGIKRRGQRARDRFVRANLRLVINMAEKYRSVPSQYADDLIQAGNLGLMRGVEKFDPTRGYKFSTYAYWWIRQGIHSFLEHHGRSIRLPTTHAAQYTKLQTAMLELSERLNRPPTRQELARETGWTLETIDRVATRPSATVSLDAPNLRRDDGGTVADAIADPSPELLELVEGADQLERLTAALRVLSPMAERIIWDQFLSPCPTPQQQLARQEGISREQLRTIVAQSLNQLRLILRGGAVLPPPLPQVVGYGSQISLPIGAGLSRSGGASRKAPGTVRRRRASAQTQAEQCALQLA
jgi:RNA polymerase primary sigma factor